MSELSQDHKEFFPEPNIEKFGKTTEFRFGKDEDMMLRIDYTEGGSTSLHFDVNSGLNITLDEKRARARLAIQNSLDHMTDFFSRDSGKDLARKMMDFNLDTTTPFVGLLFDGFESKSGTAYKKELSSKYYNWILKLNLLAKPVETKLAVMNDLIEFMKEKNRQKMDQNKG